MKFIGQSHIIRQLDEIITYLNNNEQEGISLLFRGPSGYGKTNLAMRAAVAIGKSKFQMTLGSMLDTHPFEFETRVHLIDEVHTLKEPEILYPLIDKEKWVFLFTTNHDSVLPEALTNRCVHLTFTDYSTDDLLEICKQSSVNLRNSQYLHIIEFCGRNPRVILSVLRRLRMMEINNSMTIHSMSDHDFLMLVKFAFGIEDGMDVDCRRYVQVLKKLGGRASLPTIAASMHLDVNTIKYQIEPILLYKGIISITSKGRSLL